MKTVFRFTLPFAGVAKARARSRIIHGKKGKNAGKVFASHYTPAKTRDFEEQVKDHARAAIGGGEPLACAIDLLVEFRFRIPESWPKWQRDLAARGLVHHTKKPDCSNLVKAIEDACNGVLFGDDGQVVGVIVDKLFTTGPDAIVVHGFHRPGLTVQDGRDRVALLEGYNADLRIDHLPLAVRLLLWRSQANQALAVRP